MIIKNLSRNTIYLEDIDLHLVYKDGEEETIEPDLLKKSKSLQNLLINGQIEIHKHDPKEQIEASIVYRKSMIKPKQNKAKFEKFTENNNDIEVKIHGIFYDASGYGKVNRNFALGLNKLGVKVKVDPKHSHNQLQAKELEPIAQLENTVISRDHILIDSIIPSFSEMSGGKYKILYTTIESYSVPQQFIECCSAYNEIWVTSPFAKEVLAKEIKNPIFVIPAGIDQNLYTENGPKLNFKPNIKNFVFISVFAWGYRKGYDVLLKAFFDEFSNEDDVSLLIISRYQSGQNKFHKEKIKNDIDGIMRQFPDKDLPHVVRYSDLIPEEKMPMLYRSANCFILTSRGESSCLPPPEASLCGLPVIMTNCSGQQLYLRENNAFLIEPDIIEKIPKGLFEIHYWDEQKFPRLTSKSVHNQTRQQMRFVYENYAAAKERNKNLQNLIKTELTWDKSCSLAYERLKQIKETM